MRAGIIMVAALAAAVVVEAAWIWSALTITPGSGMAGPVAGIVLRHLGALALGGVTAYALAALVLVAGMIGLDASRTHHRLARRAAPSRQDWTAAFAGTALGPLAARLLDLPPLDRDRAREGIVLHSRFDIAQARRDIAQLYSRFLVRTQFVTALTLCVALAALGLVHSYGQLALVPAVIPPVPAIAASVALAVFGILGRMIVGAAAEPLFETIAGLPVERISVEQLRRLAWRWEEGEAAPAGGAPAALSPALGQLLVRLIDALDEGRVAVVGTMAGLAAQADALALAMRAAAERGFERGEGRDPVPDLAEFQAAVTQLRALTEGLAAASRQGIAARPAEIGAARSELGREVRSLLADLE